MANTTWYGDGTATVAVGSRTVTGIGTGWLTEVAGLTPIKVGDKFGIHVGRPIVIESIDSDTQLTLADNWPGPAQTNAPYKVELTSPTIAAVEAMRRLLASLSNGNLDSLSEITIGVDDVPIGVGPGVFGTINKAGLTQGVRYDAWVANLAGRAAYNTAAAGFSVLVVDIGDGRSALYFKNSATSGDWSAASYITGPVGPSPTFTASATTLAAGASATAAANPITGGYNLAIGVPAGRSSGYPYTWSTTTTDANPGNGFIRANNASMASATLLFVSKTSAAGSALATYLLGLASSTNPTTKGDLILQRISDGAVARFSVTAVTDATNYVKISVTGHSGNTTFTNNGAINLDFSRAGDKGADGTGTGDVVGPSSAVDNFPVAFDATSGKLIKGITGAIAALHALTPAANKLPYFTGAGAAALTNLTAFARTILDDANGAAMFATMGATRTGNSSSWVATFPNGLKVQGGRSSHSIGMADAPISYTWPSAFSSVCFGAFVQAASHSSNVICGVEGDGLANASGFAKHLTTANTVSFKWLGFGD